MARGFLGVMLVGMTLATASTGCAATASGRVYVRTGPPRVAVERRLVAPGAGFVWQPGFYRWSGREYVWVAGHYEHAPRPRARWVPGRWAHDRRGWYFVDGRWR